VETGMKLLLSYNIETDSIDQYYQFVLGHYIPAMQTMGLEMSEAWHTAYGDYPQRLVGFVARDRQTMDDLLYGDIWSQLNEQLQQFVGDLRYKVIPYQEGFQL
jgi:hypothetical protein